MLTTEVNQMDQISEKEWVRRMGRKFLQWRKRNKYAGAISVPEVARFSMELINETKETV